MTNRQAERLLRRRGLTRKQATAFVATQGAAAVAPERLGERLARLALGDALPSSMAPPHGRRPRAYAE